MINVLTILWLIGATNIFLECTDKWSYSRRKRNKVRIMIESIIDSLLWPLIIFINIFIIMKQRIPVRVGWIQK